MKKYSFILLLIVYGFNSYGQFDFYEQTPPTSFSGTLLDVDFVTDDLGWAVGSDGQIIHTWDGGLSWVQLASTTIEWLNSVHFVNENLGFVAGEGGTLLRTTDGGGSWIDISPAAIVSSDDLQVVEFYNEFHGIIAGDYSLAYTDDGGDTWTAAFAPSGYDYFTDVEFATADSALAILADTAIFATIDGGANWTLATPPELDFPPEGIEVISSIHYVIVGGFGEVIYSKDLGVNWYNASMPFVFNVYDVEFIDDNNGVLCGASDAILATSDGGETWVDVGLYDTGILYAIDYSSFETATSVGADDVAEGLIYRSPAYDDILVEFYLGATEACQGDSVELLFEMKNNGIVNATEIEFFVFPSSGIPILSYDWTGDLAPGSTIAISMGYMEVNLTDNYDVTFTGDVIESNNTFSFSVDVVLTEQAGVTGPFDQCPGDLTKLEAYGGDSYKWTGLPDDYDPTLQFHTLSPTDTAYYEVLVMNSYCADTFYTAINVMPIGDSCYAESDNYAITPNNDGENDFLYIDGIPEGSNTCFIYNRWGGKVAEIKDYNNTDAVWHGDNNSNNTVTPGTYYFFLSTANNSFSKNGWVQVIY